MEISKNQNKRINSFRRLLKEIVKTEEKGDERIRTQTNFLLNTFQ